MSQLGPGPAREVIAELLNGSHFNYVMIGNETDAAAVEHVILTAKGDSKTSTPGAPASPNVPTVAGLHPYVSTAHSAAEGGDAALSGITRATAGPGSRHPFIPTFRRQ